MVTHAFYEYFPERKHEFVNYSETKWWGLGKQKIQDCGQWDEVIIFQAA